MRNRARLVRVGEVKPMTPRRRKAEDADVFAAMSRLMQRVGPDELTLVAIAAEAMARHRPYQPTPTC